MKFERKKKTGTWGTPIGHVPSGVVVCFEREETTDESSTFWLVGPGEDGKPRITSLGDGSSELECPETLCRIINCKIVEV